MRSTRGGGALSCSRCRAWWACRGGLNASQTWPLHRRLDAVPAKPHFSTTTISVSLGQRIHLVHPTHRTWDHHVKSYWDGGHAAVPPATLCIPPAAHHSAVFLDWLSTLCKQSSRHWWATLCSTAPRPSTSHSRRAVVFVALRPGPTPTCYPADLGSVGRLPSCCVSLPLLSSKQHESSDVRTARPSQCPNEEGSALISQGCAALRDGEHAPDAIPTQASGWRTSVSLPMVLMIQTTDFSSDSQHCPATLRRRCFSSVVVSTVTNSPARYIMYWAAGFDMEPQTSHPFPDKRTPARRSSLVR